MFCCLRACRNGNIRKPSAASNREKTPKIHLDPLQIGSDVVLLSNHLRITGTGGALGSAPLVQSKSYFEVKIQQDGCWSVGLATTQTDLTQKIGGRDQHSWCLCSDNATRHNNEEFQPVVVAAEKGSIFGSEANLLNGTESVSLIGIEEMLENNTGFITSARKDLTEAETKNSNGFVTQQTRHFPGEGDVVGVAFDHVELNFTFNGKNLDVPFRNVKGTVYPVIYVGDGAILDIILDNFHYSPPAGFDKIMLEQSLL